MEKESFSAGDLPAHEIDNHFGNAEIMKIVVAGAGDPAPLLRLQGGLKQPFSELWRDDAIILSLEDEYRRPDLADLGN